MSDKSFKDETTKYLSTQNSLLDIYRNPTENPLATIMATIILFGIVYEAVVTAQTYSWWVGLLVVGTGYVAYRIAKLGWRVENNYVATGLAKRDLDDTARENSDMRPSSGD